MLIRAHLPPQTKQQVTLMVRGGQSKNGNAQIDNLFRLTSPDWVSDKESEQLREKPLSTTNGQNLVCNLP